MIPIDFRPLATAAISLAVLFLAARAEEPIAPPVKPAAPVAAQGIVRPFLWRIAGAKPSYIFGSIHLPNKHLVELPPPVETAFNQAEAVYCEVPLDPDSMTAITKATLSAGKPLSQILPPDLYGRTDEALKRISPALSLQMLDDLTLWAVSAELLALDEQLKAPMTPPLDLRIYQEAQAAGKQVGGIETVDEQLQAMQGFTEAEQLEMLRATLDEMDEAKAHGVTASGELLDAYFSGDLAALDREMKKSFAGFAPALQQRIEESLLLSRNRIMAARIADKLRADPARCSFFVLGAAHLAGRGSVLELLQVAGFKLDRLEQ